MYSEEKVSDLDQPYAPFHPYGDLAEWGRQQANKDEFVKRSHTQYTAPWDSAGIKLSGNAADPAHGVPANAFKAGNFLFFVAFDICEDDGPCFLSVEETILVRRAGKEEPPDVRPEGTPEDGFVKVPNKNANDNKTCCPKGNRATLILVDGPGTVAYLKKIPFKLPYDVGPVHFKLLQTLSVGGTSGPNFGFGHIKEFDIQ